MLPYRPNPCWTKPPSPIIRFFPFFLFALIVRILCMCCFFFQLHFCCCSGRKKAHKHKLFALVNVQMALGQTAGCPRVNRAKKFMCSPRNTGNINFSLGSTGGLSQGCPDFQRVYVFKVYVPSSCPSCVLCFQACPGLIHMFRIFYGWNMRKLGWLAFSGMALCATRCFNPPPRPSAFLFKMVSYRAIAAIPSYASITIRASLIILPHLIYR